MRRVSRKDTDMFGDKGDYQPPHVGGDQIPTQAGTISSTSTRGMRPRCAHGMVFEPTYGERTLWIQKRVSWKTSNSITMIRCAVLRWQYQSSDEQLSIRDVLSRFKKKAVPYSHMILHKEEIFSLASGLHRGAKNDFPLRP